jgi:hypothetical protein
LGDFASRALTLALSCVIVALVIAGFSWTLSEMAWTWLGPFAILLGMAFAFLPALEIAAAAALGVLLLLPVRPRWLRDLLAALLAWLLASIDFEYGFSRVGDLFKVEPVLVGTIAVAVIGAALSTLLASGFQLHRRRRLRVALAAPLP